MISKGSTTLAGKGEGKMENYKDWLAGLQAAVWKTWANGSPEDYFARDLWDSGLTVNQAAPHMEAFIQEQAA